MNPIEALNEILFKYLLRPMTKQKAEEYVREIILWAREFDIDIDPYA
jgi:hypothetical protein